MVGLVLNTRSSRPDCSYNYKEYIQIKLKQPLEIGKDYLLEFWIYGRKPGRYRLGAHFSDKALYALTCDVLVETPSQIIYNDELNEAKWGKWKKVVYGFTATTANAYMTIGNFSNTNTSKEQYCYLDNIYLAKLEPKLTKKTKQPTTEKEEKEEQTIKPVTKLLPAKEIFNPANVQFKHGNAELTKDAQAELDKLIAYLNQDGDLSIRIEGHTDNSGTPSFNQVLAMDRAISVKNYLISKGIDPTRLIAVGYGASRPIADNGTVEGAQKNRRVVFEIE